ncbi:MAG: hypothetical protein J5824_02940 [Lachnospiraceae bacterium]|nr:hypothetical protein [Lachnospiraceae bacterium]
MDDFDKNEEERTKEFFLFSAKVFRWCRIFLFPISLIYAGMILYASYKAGSSPWGSILFLFCMLIVVIMLPERERSYQQYAQEAQEAIEQGSTEPYSPKGLQLRNTQQKAGKRTYYLIAGMVIGLGILCICGGIVIMLLGGKWIFWGSPFLAVSIPCFLLAVFYIGMGRSARK